jgi:colanic acid/amylovoran biosynthesis glycosyltransferase
VLVPRVPGAASAELDGAVTVRRFGFFPRRWEDLADGAIIENLRERPSRWLQVPFFFIAQMIAMRRAVRDWRPDVIHIHWIIPQGVSALVGARGIPRLLTTLGGDLYALRGGPMNAVKRRVIRSAQHVTVMNDDMRDRVIELGGVPTSVSVLPMGTTVSFPADTPARAADPKAKLLFVGRLVEKKGLAVLLEALRTLGLDNVELEVVGDGPLRANLESLASGLPVTFSGQLGREELTAAYVRSDIAIFPSVPSVSGDQDGLPVALLEALGAGCAVIVSDLPGLSEAVSDGESGLVVRPGDHVALANALVRLTSDAPLRDRLSRGARERASQYSIASIGERYRQLLTAIVEAHTTSR